MKKIAVIGSRTFANYAHLAEVLLPLQPFILISGGAQGADRLAEQFADQYQLEKVIFKAEWSKYGRGAGPVRNKLIMEACDQVVAFWDGKSTGTRQAIQYAEKLGKSVELVMLDRIDKHS